ncbi:MAG: hypothetical protein ACERKV_01080 [Clostridiaceae bacterium]
MTQNSNIPLNFKDIEDLFEFDFKQICKLLNQARSIILYDTNSYIFHCNKPNGRYYALDFFNKDDVIIFVEPIIREMKDKRTNKILDWYLGYLKELKNKVKALIFIDEKCYIDLLKFGKPSLTNTEVKIKQAFSSAFQENIALNTKIDELNPYEKDFYEKLLNLANSKGNEKNRGEIALFIAVQVLCALKEKANYKICSDDYAAYSYIVKLTDILENFYPKANIGYISTLRMIQEIARNNDLNYEKTLEYFDNIKRKEGTKIFIKEIPYDTKRHVFISDKNIAENLINKKIEILF